MTEGAPSGEAADRRIAIRSTPRRSGGARAVPGPDDLYQRDNYAEALLRSLIRAQLGVTLSVLIPAAAVVAVYPLLSVLIPSVASLTVGPLPLSILVLGFGIYPPLVALALWYVRRARRVEERFTGLLRDQ